MSGICKYEINLDTCGSAILLYKILLFAYKRKYYLPTSNIKYQCCWSFTTPDIVNKLNNNRINIKIANMAVRGFAFPIKEKIKEQIVIEKSLGPCGFPWYDILYPEIKWVFYSFNVPLMNFILQDMDDEALQKYSRSFFLIASYRPIPTDVSISRTSALCKFQYLLSKLFIDTSICDYLANRFLVLHFLYNDDTQEEYIKRLEILSTIVSNEK